MSSSSLVSLVVPLGYGWVVLEGVLMCLQCFHEGMTVFKVRERLFGKSFGAKHFPNVQQELTCGQSRCSHSSAAQQRPLPQFTLIPNLLCSLSRLS
jgi:hypothetical protein